MEPKTLTFEKPPEPILTAVIPTASGLGTVNPTGVPGEGPAVVQTGVPAAAHTAGHPSEQAIRQPTGAQTEPTPEFLVIQQTATAAPLTAAPGFLPPRRQQVWKRNPLLNFITGLFNADTWRAFAFSLVAGILGFVAFWYLAVPVLSTMWGFVMLFEGFGWFFLGLILLAITLPILALIILGARGWASLYRRLTQGFWRDQIDPPPAFHGQRIRNRRDIWPALKSAYRDGTGWRAILYLLTCILTTAASLLVSVFTLIPGLVALTYPLWWHLLRARWVTDPFWQPGMEWNPILIGPGATVVSGPRVVIPGWNDWAGYFHYANWIYPLNTPLRIATVALLGLLALLIWAALMRAFGRLYRLLGRTFLGARPSDIREARLRAQRESVVNDADLRLRQIERDLHDGTQAQLVAVAMLLGEARELLAAGAPKPAEGLVETAHLQVKDALTELREIVSGIRPPALDAGLGVALQTLAARCPVPVALTVGPDIDEDLDPAEAAIAYYSISELLGNVVKHAGARTASVEVLRNGTVLHIRVRDDGSGGAVIDGASGTGLPGIAERLAAIDGTMYVHSPEGGPTIIDLTIPTHTRR